MILHIDTTRGHEVEVSIRDGKKNLATNKFTAKYSQAEKLLPEINKLLKKSKFKLVDIKKIKVANRGGTFTALRIGVVTANALGYALGIPVEGCKRLQEVKKDCKRLKKIASGFDIIKPIYDKEPNITVKKRKI